MIRKASLLIASLAYVGVPLWTSFALQRDAQAQRAAHAFACGNAAMGIIIFGLLLSATLSLVASAFALASFRKLPSPRSRFRTLELVFIAFPLLAGIVSVALLFLYA